MAARRRQSQQQQQQQQTDRYTHTRSTEYPPPPTGRVEPPTNRWPPPRSHEPRSHGAKGWRQDVGRICAIWRRNEINCYAAVPQIGRNPVSVLKPDSPRPRPRQKHPFLVQVIYAIWLGLPTNTNTSTEATANIIKKKNKQAKRTNENITYTCRGTLTHINQLDTRTAGRSKSALESSAGSRGVRWTVTSSDRHFSRSRSCSCSCSRSHCRSPSAVRRWTFAFLKNRKKKQTQLRTPLGDVSGLLSVSVLLVSGLRRPIYRLPKTKTRKRAKSNTIWIWNSKLIVYFGASELATDGGHNAGHQVLRRLLVTLHGQLQQLLNALRRWVGGVWASHRKTVGRGGPHRCHLESK